MLHHEDFSTQKAWLDSLVGYGPLFLILYFAFRGGSFSIGAIRVTLVIMGSILALLVAITFAHRHNGPTLAQIFSWQSLPTLSCYAFLIWAFFLSPSVRLYVHHRRTKA